MSSETISLIVSETEDTSRTKGAFFSDASPKIVELPLETIKRALHDETEKLLVVLDEMPAKSGWKLDTVEVGVEISAEGGVSFIGTAKVGANTSLKLSFKR